MAEYLNNYTAEETAQYEKLVNFSIERLPYTLSSPIKRIMFDVNNHQYSRAKDHMLDFMGVSISFVSFILFRLLQRKHKQNPQIQKALEDFIRKIDQKRPLSMGDWLNDLFNPLMLTSIKFLPDIQLIKSFQSFIFDKRKNILLGDKNTPSIVQIRNIFKGHAMSLSEEINRGVVKDLEPRLFRLIQALQPLTACSYDIGLDRYLICFKENGGVTIDLYPMVFADANDFRYVFQTLIGEQANYVSSNENALPITTEGKNSAIDQSFQEIMPSFDISKELNWMEMKNCMRQESLRYLGKVYTEKKYNRELFVERYQLTKTLHMFWKSNCALFPLMGEAGQGKTNQLCFWTEELIAEDKPVLVFSASDFEDCTLDNVLKKVFCCNYKKDISRLLDSIHTKAVENNQPIYVFFDALNECLRYPDANQDEDGPLALFQAIRNLFCSPSYTHFKTLLTCRIYTWKNVIQSHIHDDDRTLFSSEDEGGMVRGFNKDEAEYAYHIYQDLYQMHTPYDKLDRRVMLRLKDPLILKYSSANYLGTALPKNPGQYTSLSLFDKMMDSIDNSYAGHRQREIIERMADYMLDLYMRGYPVDSIPVEDLKIAYQDSNSELHTLARLIYKKDGISTAYAELLHKADRPVLKETRKVDGHGEHIFIQFVYERFLEFVLGNALVKKGHAQMGETTYLPASFYVEIMQRTSVNVVFLGTMRNALLQECLHFHDFSTIVSLEKQWGEDYSVLSLVTETINTMIRENYEDELFHLIGALLETREEDPRDIESFNTTVGAIQSNQADENLISKYKSLSAKLASTIRLKKLASVSVINGILLTDYFNEQLYAHDAMAMLWRIMLDPVYDIRNDACMYTYYLSNKKSTQEFTPLKENLTVRIVREMYGNVRRRGIIRGFLLKKQRSNAMIYLETATRLCVLMIIDHARNDDDYSKRIVSDMLLELKDIFKYLTWDWRLLRLFMPLFQIVMKRQITFQSEYVNNVIEYQTAWDSDTFSENEYRGVSWDRSYVNKLSGFSHHYLQYGHLNGSIECATEEKRFEKMHKVILSAYKTGDSFSFLILERILVIMGTSRWQNIAPIVESFFTDEFRTTPWFDYCQMSMLYVLYQVAYYTPEQNDKLLTFYEKEAADWTLRNKGLFKGRKSERSNPTGLYKRNVMCWYAVVYCVHSGDDKTLNNDMRPVPKFYELIDSAIDNNDKELLYHLIDNILELITDMGYIRTALSLLKHILLRFDEQKKIDRLNSVQLKRSGIYRYDLVRLVGTVLCTARNYHTREVDTFIQKEIVGVDFPGVATYRENVLNYHPSGEMLPDLLTHRFGNFLMWGLLHVKEIDDFFEEAIEISNRAKNSLAWYEQGVKIFVKHFFGIKL